MKAARTALVLAADLFVLSVAGRIASMDSTGSGLECLNRSKPFLDLSGFDMKQGGMKMLA